MCACEVNIKKRDTDRKEFIAATYVAKDREDPMTQEELPVVYQK